MRSHLLAFMFSLLLVLVSMFSGCFIERTVEKHRKREPDDLMQRISTDVRALNALGYSNIVLSGNAVFCQRGAEVHGAMDRLEPGQGIQIPMRIEIVPPAPAAPRRTPEDVKAYEL